MPDRLRRSLERTSQPDWVAPMLATLTHDYFSDGDWIFEPKLDGERVLAWRKGGHVRLLSRNKNDVGASYPEIAEALERQDADGFIIDGEVVAFDGDVTSFSRLQRRIHLTDPDEARRTGIEVFYYVFDLLYAEGHDLTRLPLVERKRLLRDLLSWRDPLRYMEHRAGDGERYLEEACRKRWEGLIAKRADARYEHRRSREWLKFKCIRRQEFVIGGFTEPRGSRVGLGALLLGYYEYGALRYSGKVGTGFDERELRELRAQLEPMERKTPPFEGDVRGADVHWVRPALVCEVAFAEWTRDGRLRHPRYEGLRRDKDPKDVIREDA